MKIAVLGGGITGLTAAYQLARKKHQVTVFEREKYLGGLAAGFKKKEWDWYLEKTIHHLFSNDREIINFAYEVGFKKVIFSTPETASFYNYRIFPVDSPQDLLKIPYLSLTDKLRAGLTFLFFKLSPFLKIYEQTTSIELLKKTMGDRGYFFLFNQLFRKKFGKYAENILASFIWARIKKRTKKLGYFQGGFQTFVDFLQKICVKNAVIIKTNCGIETIEKKGSSFLINNQLFDAVISTLPTPVLIKVGEKILPKNYLNRLKKIKYLHSVSLILETKEPIIQKAYWLNILDKNVPLMGIFAQTNFIDKKNYANHHLTYFGWYLDESDWIWRQDKDTLVKFVKDNLAKHFSLKKINLIDSFLFKAKYAQPIFDKEFIKVKPDFQTSIKNFYIANLDMTYPYDRGTNYAVKLGKEAAKIIESLES
jgi:protoporphyrinogen oxidase